MSKFRTLLKVGLIFGVALAGAVGAAYVAGILPGGGVEEPSVSVQDIGDWGDVTDEKIEVIHVLNVQNPNPVSAQVGNSTTLNIQLQLNGIRLGSVQKTGLDIQQGTNTVEVTSELQQDRIAEFWSRFINQDETIHARISVSMEVNTGPGFSISTPPIRVSALTDAQPVSDALVQMGNEMEGTYTKEVNTDKISEQYRPESGFDIGPSGTVTAEYTVENVEFEWGTVSPEQTELLINMRVSNTGETPLPGVPDGVATDILLNDVEVFHARSEAIAVRNVDADSVIRPGETKSYTLVATADNQNIEQWLTSYASQREQSDVRGELEFYFSLGDASISIPNDGAVAYECQFQTGIFVDNQSNSTTCGENGTVKIGDTQFDQSELEGSDGTATETPDEESDTTATPTDESPPTAQIQATPTEGEAPLEVSFDASESSDPNGDIARYVWRFKDGSTPAEGETVKHTFRTAGEYNVELVVIDSQGNRDTATVTVTVESRVG